MPDTQERKLTSEEIEYYLSNSRRREKRFKELNAPKAIIDNEKSIQRGMYAKKVIGYHKLFKKLMERMRCFLL